MMRKKGSTALYRTKAHMHQNVSFPLVNQNCGSTAKVSSIPDPFLSSYTSTLLNLLFFLFFSSSCIL
uniref:Uncharacterized protein n=1 Tax=Rhizophora mucronata TaxID=61149 RepID=A0A2P2QSP1_RHIMU